MSPGDNVGSMAGRGVPAVGPAVLALVLIAPAPTVGVLAGLYGGGGALGTAVWALAKVWLFGLPLLWLVAVDRGRISLSPLRRGGLGAGLATGVVIMAVIGLAYWVAGQELLARAALVERLAPVGLTRPEVYLAATAYWVLVNSVLEEYAYRWFIFTRFEAFLPGPAAAVAAAALFSVHHYVALAAYAPTLAAALGTLGVFVGGLVWSILYARYRSIWPAYLSHACADVAVFGLGWLILFG